MGMHILRGIALLDLGFAKTAADEFGSAKAEYRGSNMDAMMAETWQLIALNIVSGAAALILLALAKRISSLYSNLVFETVPFVHRMPLVS